MHTYMYVKKLVCTSLWDFLHEVDEPDEEMMRVFLNYAECLVFPTNKKKGRALNHKMGYDNGAPKTVVLKCDLITL